MLAPTIAKLRSALLRRGVRLDKVMWLLSKVRGKSAALTVNVLDSYVKAAPSNQNILEIFDGEWSSAMPDGSGLKSVPGPSRLFEDARIAWAEHTLGGFKGKDVLELGPLEGGHSFMLERAGARSVVAIEANRRAFLKCLCIKEIFRLDRVQFKLGDFVAFLDGEIDRFDAVVASGVLYHMTDPVKLLKGIAKVSDKILLWTHYYDQALIKGTRHELLFEEPHNIEAPDFIGVGARRFYTSALLWQGFCGGSEAYAVWLTKDTILESLKRLGFNRIDISSEQVDHPNGPAFAVCAQRLPA
jgi:SAM-dependent methyltransferase